eukprot:6179419-Pleurochrysis_carterae.AAC.2
MQDRSPFLRGPGATWKRRIPHAYACPTWQTQVEYWGQNQGTTAKWAWRRRRKRCSSWRAHRRHCEPPSPPPMNAGDESDEPGNASMSELPAGHELEARGDREESDSDGTGATNDDLTALGGPAPPLGEAVIE